MVGEMGCTLYSNYKKCLNVQFPWVLSIKYMQILEFGIFSGALWPGVTTDSPKNGFLSLVLDIAK